MFGGGKKAVGFNIDDRSVEIVELKKKGTRAKVLSMARSPLPRGVVVGGLIKDAARLKTIIIATLARANPQPITAKKVIFALPESQVYHSIIAVAPADDLAGAVSREAGKNLPLEKNDLLLTYRPLAETAKNVSVFLTATSRRALADWIKLLAEVDLQAEICETESFALARDLILLDAAKAVCVVDVGAVKTNIAVWKEKAIYYSASFNVAGNLFTKQIAQQFKLKLLTAERKKMQLGLNAQIYPVLAKSLAFASAAIAEAIAYSQEKYGLPVKEVIVVGGSSRLKGLVEYLQERLKLPVGVGRLKSLAQNFPLEYYGASGLALRGLFKDKFSGEPSFSVKTKVAALTAGKNKFNFSQPALAPSAGAAPVKEETSMNNAAALAMQKKLAFEKKVLLIILVVGVVLIGLAFWYRNQERAKQAAASNRLAGVSFSEVQSFDFKLPVNLDAKTSKTEQIKGRVVEDVVNDAADLAAALTQSKNRVSGGLTAEEAIWSTPLNEILATTKPAFPLTLRWLIYSSKDAVKLSLAKVDALNSERTAYAFNKMEALSVEKTAQAETVYLTIRLTIFLNKPLAAAQNLSAPVEETTSVGTASTTAAVAAAGKQVKIKPTETGWLNVRQGPGISFPLVRKLDIGGVYELLAEQGEWVKIKLSAEESGWVAGRYIQKF